MKRKLVLVTVIAIVGAFALRHAMLGAPALAPIATGVYCSYDRD